MLLNSVKVSEKIKLAGTFKESMKQLEKYPVLVQYVKLSDVMYDWFDSMYSNTKDSKFIYMKQGFVKDTVNNFDIYVETGDINGIGQMVKELKSTMVQLFSK